MGQSAVFTSASSDVANFTRVDDAPAGSVGGGQVLRVFAHGNNSAGTATVQLALVNRREDGSPRVIARLDATVAAVSGKRSAGNNGGGDYLCTVEFAATNTDKMDLLGSESDGVASDGYEWRLGVTALTGFTSLTLRWFTTPLV